MMGVTIDLNVDSNRRIDVYSTSTLSDPHTNPLILMAASDDFSNVRDHDRFQGDPYRHGRYRASDNQPQSG